MILYIYIYICIYIYIYDIILKTRHPDKTFERNGYTARLDETVTRDAQTNHANLDAARAMFCAMPRFV